MKRSALPPSAPEQWPEAAILIDARGLQCPQPVLRTRAALRHLKVDELLHLVATDPHTELDIAAFCARTGHQLLASHAAEGLWWFALRKR